MPDSAPILRNRVEALIHTRKLEEAEADLARAVEIDGHEDSPYLWHRRAQIVLARGDGQQTDRMLDEVLKRDASYDVVLLQVVSIRLHGDLTTARQRL